MKKLQQLCGIAALTLVLNLNAFAGQMETPFVPPAPKLVADKPNNLSAPAGVPSSEMTTADSLTEAALDILQIALSVF